MKKPKKKIASRRVAIISVFFLVVITMGMYNLFQGHMPLSDPSQAPCPVVFGDLECFNEKVVMPFFNPNDIKLENIKIFVPKANGVDIYEIDQPLDVNKTEVLIFHSLKCDSMPPSEDLKIRWCCGSCFEAPLKNASSDFEIEKTELEDIRQEYPEYPSMNDCNNITGFSRDFCLNDHAEINNDITKCDLIEDKDIKIHCIARISLDEEMCKEISEDMLKDSCLESISLKKQWSQ